MRFIDLDPTIQDVLADPVIAAAMGVDRADPPRLASRLTSTAGGIAPSRSPKAETSVVPAKRARAASTGLFPR